MTTISTLMQTAEEAKIDRIIITIQPKGDGEGNATVHFAVDQRASMDIDSEANALRMALSKAIMTSGSSDEIESAIADSLNRLKASLRLGVEKYRAKNTTDDVIQALMVASVSSDTTETAQEATKAAPSDAGEDADEALEPDTAKTPESTNGHQDFGSLNLDL